jgi:hypothetical protein
MLAGCPEYLNDVLETIPDFKTVVRTVVEQEPMSNARRHHNSLMKVDVICKHRNQTILGASQA